VKAIIYEQYGPPEVLQFKELAKPIPADKEVLIQVRAASANPLDWHFMRGEPWLIHLMLGVREPKEIRLGVDVSGVVEAIGRNVTKFKPGDEVFGGCSGAFAEYLCAKEDKLVLKPGSLSFEQAASVPLAAITALQGLRDKGQIKPGQKVLIEGASGGVGTFAIQIAKAFGAEVTAVCSTRNLDRARELGADHVIDYTREDFTRNGRRYELIFAANAYHSLFAYRRALSREGICVKVGGKGSLSTLLLESLLSLILSVLSSKKVCGMLVKINKADLLQLKELLEAGKVISVIDRRYPLSETVEAIRYLEAGHAQGKVILTVGDSLAV
jgi:NADPH:quinone reductase-like Zn-dependent oxidoreductase